MRRRGFTFGFSLMLCCEPSFVAARTADNGATQEQPAADYHELLESGYRQIVRLYGQDHPTTIQLALQTADYYRVMGDTVRAEELALTALASLERIVGDMPGPRAYALVVLGSIYLEQSRIAEGERLFRRAIPDLERGYGPNHPVTISALTRLGVSLVSDRPVEAIPFLQRSVSAAAASREFDHPVNQQQELLFAESMLARAYMAVGQIEDAERSLLDVLSHVSENLGVESTIATLTIDQLGTIAYSRNQFGEAERRFAQAFEPNLRHRGQQNLETINAALHLAAARMRMPDRTALAVAPARAAAEGMRARLATYALTPVEDARGQRERRFSGNAFSTLADAIWAARAPSAASGLDPAEMDEVFIALQDAASGSVSRAVAEAAVRRYAERQGARLGELVRERMSLARQWDANSARYSQLLGQPGIDRDGGAHAANERARLEAGIAAIDDRLRVEFPDYFELVRPRALNLRQARALLEPDEAMLLIVPTALGSHAMAITRTEIAWNRSSLDQDQVSQMIAVLIADIRNSIAGRTYTYNRQVAHTLYTQIIAPVAPVLARRRHVFVVTAGALTSLPLGVLVTDPPEGRDDDASALRTTHWLADAYRLNLLPSIQALQLLRRSGRRAAATEQNEFIGFGDPVLQGPAQARGRGSDGGDPATLFTSARDGGGTLADIAAIRRLSRLPGTATELERMRAMLGAPTSSLYLSERATEHAFRTIDLSQTRIIALATHGLLAGNLAAPAEPGLVLTPPDYPTADDDGYLSASEIASLQLDADWIILSACDTAAGDGTAGAPGLSGLARAFFYAGARNLLASHWPVVDEVAPRLTARMIELIATTGISRTEALQSAMREVREDSDNAAWAHPGVWGPFSLIGDDPP